MATFYDDCGTIDSTINSMYRDTKNRLANFLDSKGWGELLVLENLSGTEGQLLRQTVMHARAYIESRKPQFRRSAQVEFALLDSGRFELRACCISEDFYCVFLTRAVPLLLMHLLIEITGNKSCPLSIRTPGYAYDQKNIRELRFLHHHLTDLEQEKGEIACLLQTGNPLADLLYLLMIDTLISHECAHIFQGHLSLFPAQSYCEFDQTKPVEFRNGSFLDRQSLELAADTEAAFVSFASAVSLIHLGADCRNDWKTLLPTISEVTYFWAYATYLLLRYSAYIARSSSAADPHSLRTRTPNKVHPPSAVRYFGMLGSSSIYTASHFGRNTVFTQPQITSLAWLHVDFAINHLYGVPAESMLTLGQELAIGPASTPHVTDYCPSYLEMLHERQYLLEGTLNGAALIPVKRKAYDIFGN